ncbi:MAG: DNA alkylation repair protein [Erysipelotrichaceae bacterium]|nr:DNA alkylation repair protein [Erysipelotrichaceae bacterium]
MKKEGIVQRLFELRDEDYARMQCKIIPTVDPKRIIGVRTPVLKELAKELAKDEDRDLFLMDLPHGYFDEDQLHAFVISLEKDFGKCIDQVETFLPYIDNWATCDQLSPKVFRKHKEELLPHIDRWIASGKTYLIRFAVGMLMEHFLDQDFRIGYADKVVQIVSDEYYVNMMRAWYFATALCKQYEQIIQFIEQKKLDVWTHNKAIQKSIESRRIPEERKDYLRSLRIREKI